MATTTCKQCNDQRKLPAQKRSFFQAKLSVNSPGDRYEREADAMAEKVVSNRGSQTANGMAGLGISPISEYDLQMKCAECEEEGKVQRKAYANGGTVDSGIEASIQSARSGGQKLGTDTASFMSSHFGTGFQDVKIHHDTRADQLSRKLNARAFTTGNNIFFKSGEYNPHSTKGKKLLAHELTHVVQQTGRGGLAEQLEEQVGIGGAMIQRDLAVEPPNASAEARELTDAEIQAAIAWNQRRFKDPFNIMNVRDVMGIDPYPAVIDRDFVEALVEWQAMFNLRQDGKMGANTTRTFLIELRAEGATAEADTLAVDNIVDTVDVSPRAYNTCAPGLPFEFDWRVAFRTTMRNGFIIQKIENTFNATMCNGSPYTGWTPIRTYWEAWRVDGVGNVTPMIAGVNDIFTRPLRPGSRGNWVMRGTLYTTRTLPSSFVAGAIQEAGILPATLSNPGNDFLGYVANRRRVGGTWNCCTANSTHTAS